MATTTTEPNLNLEVRPAMARAGVPAWPQPRVEGSVSTDHSPRDYSDHNPSQHDALQALLAFSALHEQVRRRKALAVKHRNFDGSVVAAELETSEFEATELFVLDEVLQLVTERAVAITGADGVAIALAENNEIVLRAAAGTVRPDVGARIDRDSAFSGASFRTAQIINCDDTETDPRVNLQACRKLGARSMIAVPLCGRRRVIGLLEAFSAGPFGFNDTDVGSLSLLAELVVSALKPEDEDRFAQSAQIAAAKLETTTQPAVRKEIPPPVLAEPERVLTDRLPGDRLFGDRILDHRILGHRSLGDRSLGERSLGDRVSAKIVAPVATPPEKPVTAAPVATASVETIIDALPSTVILDEPSVELQNAPEVAAATATHTTPTLTFGQLEPERSTHRPGILVLLIAIVIAAAFGVGVWWKLKTAQLGSVMVTTEKNAKPVAAADNPDLAQGDPTHAPVPAVPDLNAATGAQANPDEISDADSDTSPAPAQEMSKFPRVSGIRHWSSADSSTVVLDLEDQVQYEEHQIPNPNRYYYDLRDTQLAPELAGKSIEVGDGFLTRIRLAQPVAGMTRVVLETKAGANLAHPGVSLEPNPYRLVIQVRKTGSDPKGAVNLFPNSPEAEKNKLAIVVPPPTKEDMQLRAHVPKLRIVVDAGHGGWDLGTVGRRGLLEKDLVLEIAQRLGKLLETRLGSEVILTRNDDNYIPLDQRAEMANQAQADLFVSVHANYSDLPSARGVETYYTNFFSAPGSKENARAGSTGAKPEVTPTLSAADLHERIEQSRRLAASVQHSLYGTLAVQNPGLRDRGIKEAGFVVLTESAMPGILAEVSFVSSPTDEQKLRSDGYREQIAEALYKGIARYAASSKGMKIASAGK